MLKKQQYYYCYYSKTFVNSNLIVIFAVILQNEFGGEIKWIKGCSHIVWVDENGLAYDIEGFRNDLCLVELVPLSMLDEEASKSGKGGLESFRHRLPGYRLSD